MLPKPSDGLKAVNMKSDETTFKDMMVFVETCPESAFRTLGLYAISRQTRQEWSEEGLSSQEQHQRILNNYGLSSYILGFDGGKLSNRIATFCFTPPDLKYLSGRYSLDTWGQVTKGTLETAAIDLMYSSISRKFDATDWWVDQQGFSSFNALRSDAEDRGDMDVAAALTLLEVYRNHRVSLRSIYYVITEVVFNTSMHYRDSLNMNQLGRLTQGEPVSSIDPTLTVEKQRRELKEHYRRFGARQCFDQKIFTGP